MHCGAAFIRSFATFEHLPLIEFELEQGLGDEEAGRLIAEDPGGPAFGGGAQYGEEDAGGANVLRIDDPEDYRKKMDDPFMTAMMTPNQAIVASRHMLRQLRPSEVLVRTWPNPRIRKQYFRLMDNDLPMTIGPCGHFFEQVRRGLSLSCNFRMCTHSASCRMMILEESNCRFLAVLLPSAVREL